MKRKILIVFIITLLIISSLSSTIAYSKQSIDETDEKVTLHIVIHQPFSKQIIEKNVPVSVADSLIDQCKTYYPNPADNTDLINTLIDEIFDESEITKEYLKQLLTPPFFFQNLLLSRFHGKRTSSSGSESFCSIASGGSGKTFPFFLLPRPRIFISWEGNQENEIAITTVGSIMSDRGFIATGGQNGTAIGFMGVGLTYGTHLGRFYAFTGYSISVNVHAEHIDFFPPNRKPVISNSIPADYEQDIPLTLSELSFHISDGDNDFMSYVVTTDPYIGLGSGNLKLDGMYSIPVSNLEQSTEYSWTVSVDDGKDTTVDTFHFTTAKHEPVVRNPYPPDYISVQTSLSELRFDLYDAQGNLMDYSVETSPDIGSQQGVNISDGTISVPISGLLEDTWYYWYVNVTDGIYWTRKMYSFFTGELDLIGYWDFDEGIGSVLHDNSVFGNDGIIHGASWTNGIRGNALRFDGINDYVDIGNDKSIKPDFPITISCWIKAERENSYSIIFLNDKWKNNKGYYGVLLLKNEDDKFKINYGDGDEGGPDDRRGKESTTIINTNIWYHVVGIVRGPTDMDIYINGVNDGGSYDGSGGSTIGYSDSSGYIAQTGHLEHFFEGIIDEMRIYNRALSENEILDLYENIS
jgi:hypothetical protein